MEGRLLIRQAFQTFLLLQSKTDRPAIDRQADGRVWPMDHTLRGEPHDWTLDWRWFSETEAFQE